MSEPDPKDADNPTWPEIKKGQIEGIAFYAELAEPSDEESGESEP